MTPRELIDKLCELYGVDNPNQLAPLVGFEPAQLYSWRNKHEPNFENTMRLLETAGVLKFDDPQPREAPQTLHEKLLETEQRVASLQAQVLELQNLFGSLEHQTPPGEEPAGSGRDG